jgi:hypothetical protein
MTGKSHIKTRVYLSDALLSPLSGRKSYRESAIDFKGNVSLSVSSPRLDANLAVKALSIGKATSQDTDGKKRTNKGGIPGVENFEGFRYNPKAKGGPGKVFRLSTTYEDRINPTRQKPNWGWIDDERLPENKQEEKQSDISIRMRKYKVSPRTGEVIEESGALLDPFSVSGKPAPKGMEEKRLPGRTLSEMNPSGNLASHAARGAGVLTDMDGKLRCPPGTPAANQFTDIAGSNCFGISSGEIIQGAKKIAGLIAQGIGELDLFNTRQTAVPTVDGPDGTKIPVTGTVRNSSKFWKKFGIDVGEAGRVPWETNSGKRDFPSEMTPREFADANKETHRIFLNGAERGRKNLRMQRERIKKALEVVGATQPSGWDKNSDIEEAFRLLTESGYVTTVFGGRPKSEKAIDAICSQVLSRRDKKAFNSLPDAEKAKLIALEKDRYFRAERAMMSEVLNMYISNPEHMRTVDSINWTNTFDNEANANWNFVDGAFGTDSTFININMGKILENMSAYMPAIEENERLRIDALGGSEAANAQELNDFMVSTYAFSKQTAAMIGGEESFARHIMSHEIMHTMQIRALSKMIAEQVDSSGAITVNGRIIKSADELSNEEIQSLLIEAIRGGVELDKFNKIMQKAEVIEFLSGRYIAEKSEDWQRGEKTFEILAEIGALRAQGIIHGDDIDDALAWMDNIADTRHIEDRNISDAQELQRFENVFKGATPDLADISTLPEGAQERVKQSWADRASRYKKEFIDSLDSFSDNELVDMLGDLDLKKEISEKDLLDNPGDKKIEKEFFDIREKIKEISAEWRKKTGLDNQALRRFIKANRDDNEKFDSETLRKIQAAKEKADRKNNIENVFTDEELALEYAYLSMPESISGYTADEAEALKAEIRSGVVTRGKRDDPSQSTQKILKDFDKEVDNLVTEKFRSREIEVPGETSDDARKKVEALKISNFKESMTNSTADEIVDEIGTLELQKEILKAEFNANPKDEELARRLSETEKQLKIAKSTWKDKTGLESSILKTRVAVNREENNKLNEVDGLAQQVEELEKLKPATSVTPRNKLKSFESTKKLDKYADEERKHLIRQATGEEDIAIREMSDTEDSLAASLLDPGKRVDAIIAIGKNYDELISSGVSPEDANRGTEANVANQVDSILIPSLELIDKSSVPDSFEMETSFDLDEKQIAAAPDSDIIDVDGFTAGTVLHGERPIFNGPDTSGRPSATEGKTRYRVVLQVEEGQKGYFPHWSDTSSQKPEEFDQKFVMPPGKIKIVGTREEENGSTTLIAKFVEQKNVEQTLDSVLSGPDSEKIPPGARFKIEKSVNEHVVSRRQQGKHDQVKTPLTVKKEVEALNTLSIDDIGSDGGSFGFPVDSDYVEKMSDVADAPDGIDTSVFGPVTTASRRREIRREAVDTTHSRLLAAMESNTVDSELQIDPEDISPEVKSLIQSSTPRDIEDMVADEAMRIHSELDPRPRVIVREDELESIIDVGGLVNKSDSAVDVAGDFYDIGDGVDTEPGLSSGRLFGSLTNRVIQGKIKDRLDRTDLSDDQKDTIMFVTDLAGAAKFGGPKAIAIEAARRGGREVAEYAVQKLVEDGKITVEQAQSAMRAVDKIAPEGVPEPVKRQLMQGIDAARDVVFTDENIDKAQDAISGAREAFGERANASRDTASRVLSRLRNAGGGKEKEPSVDDMLFESFSQTDDPFGENIPTLKPAKPAEVTFDPFTGEPMSPPDAGSAPSRIDPNNPLAIDPFTGMPEAPQEETSRRRRRIFGGNRGRVEDQAQLSSDDPNDPFADFTPDRSAAISAADRALDPFGDDWTRPGMGLSSGGSGGSGQSDEDATISRIRSIPTTQYDVTGNRGALKITNSSKDIQQGLSSGREGGGNVRRDLKRGSIEAIPMIISTDKVEDDYRNKQYYEAEVWNIGGEKIVFGLTRKVAGRNWGDEQFENIPINPYKISGYSPDTPEGKALALKWLSANVAFKGKDRTRVEALLYAASRGDSDAMDELDRLAAEGDALIEKAKVDRVGDWKPSEYQLSEVKKERLDNLKIEDLYLVHETKYDTEQDADGNFIVRPMGDYEIRGYDGETVDADGNPHEYYRGTVHFTLNHLAKGHMFRQRSDKPTNVIIIPLKDMLEANPGSLDVLYPVDTYLTPKPNEPLRFPKGVTRVVKNEGGENADKVVSDALREMGSPHVFEGGESYSTTGQDVSVKLIADEMGAGFGAHADKIHASYERITSTNDMTFGISARDVADMSENARLRIANNDRWLGARVRVEDNGLFSGGTRTRRTPRTGTRTNAAVPGVINRNSTPQQGEPLVIPGIGKVSDSGVLSGIEIDSSIRRGKLKARGSGLSSGANRLALSNAQGKNVERNLSRGDLDESPVKLKSSDVVDEYRVTAKSWKIGNKNIVFGADDSTKWEGNPEFESFPINPYEISGYSETSEEGKEFARKWIFAKMQHGIESEQTDGEPTYVEALLYAAVRGDQDAAEKLNELERKGRERDEEERQTILKDWEERKASRKSAIDDEKLSDMNIDDLFVVHETTYDPQTDENGDLILRPANDYEMLDKDGNPILDEQGRPYDLYRDTIHFAVNHVVEGHMMRGSKEESNIIVVPLRSVVEANKGSLDTLYTIDTYFTPEPGKPLRLPGARVIKNTGQERIGGELSEMMKEMGGNGRTFNGGSHYSSPGADALTAEVGLELGVLAHNLHGNLPAGYFEKQRKHDKRKFSIDPYTLARMSDNSLLRVANDNRFYEIQTETTRTGRGLASGAINRNSAPRRDELAPPSVQLAPVGSIDEAKRTGRPLSVLRPGTMPPRTQELYDTYLQKIEAGEPLDESMQYSNDTPLDIAIREEYAALGFSENEIYTISQGMKEFLNKLEWRDGTKETRLQESVKALEKADVVISVDSKILEKLITDGRFKTQFETNTSRGALNIPLREQTDAAQFGYHPSTAPEMRPVYGYLTTGGTIDKNRFAMVKQYGDLQFVLKRSTNSRTTYTTTDSLDGAFYPSPLGTPSADAARGRSGLYSEAQIHGGVSLDDVDYVVVSVGVPDRSHWQNNKVSEEEFESISGMLAQVGIRVVPVRDGEIIDVWNGGNIIPEPPADVVPEPEPVEAVA